MSHDLIWSQPVIPCSYSPPDAREKGEQEWLLVSCSSALFSPCTCTAAEYRDMLIERGLDEREYQSVTEL